MSKGPSAKGATPTVLGYVGGPFPIEVALAFGLSPKLLDRRSSAQRTPAPVEEWLDEREDAEIKSVFGRAMLDELGVRRAGGHPDGTTTSTMS